MKRLISAGLVMALCGVLMACSSKQDSPGQTQQVVAPEINDLPDVVLIEEDGKQI